MAGRAAGPGAGARRDLRSQHHLRNRLVDGVDRVRRLDLDVVHELRDLLRRYLGDNGFNVYVAENALTMNRLWLRERFDLLVLDLMLPGEDGLSILRRLRGANDTTPIIMLTTESQESKKMEGQAAGAKAWVVKPFQPAQMLAAVSKLILP